MKKHIDLLSVLRSHKMRVTPARRVLLQFILDNKSRYLSLADIHRFVDKVMPGVDRSSIYRNLEAFKRVDIVQELNLPKMGKRFQYIFDRRVHHFFICKACGKINRGNSKLFDRIEKALKEIHGFNKAKLSAVFYGHCDKCSVEGNSSP